MQLYESIVVVSPQATPEEIDSFVQEVEQSITREDGKLQKKENWGKIKLGYTIKKFDEGIYLYFVYQGKSGIVESLEKKLKIKELVLRYMTVKLKGPPKEVDVQRLRRDLPREGAELPGGMRRREWNSPPLRDKEKP